MFLGVSPQIMQDCGTHIVHNPALDAPLPGYNQKCDILVWDGCGNKDLRIISYSSRLDPREAAEYIAAHPVKRNIKYLFTELPEKPVNAAPVRKLTASDYPLYEQFFRDTHPNVRDLSWLREYFAECAAAGYSFGAEEDGRLVSVTDAPTMPFMADQTQEIGINTHPAYRHKGYAAAVCRAMIAEELFRGICPMWSTDEGNIASQKLAERLGFKKIAEMGMISI
jgi:GNAT superfamily N-acetyltransferase